ncbi:hypothetical protein [Levilactobacillus bambusae]|uniref:Uncharacterized protein n=1 Tax=Levilactobacillus bambusae TaxID=2024736 RepID=A0A2V1MYC7_9LACO|nr:hypothetical protein [Levilactobacillus bambusae]PWG00021.1 hypothetical protein DCM90_03530 [Levilactobacillus bambusae]
MTKDELLNYLLEKRSDTAGVAKAKQTLATDQSKLAKGKQKFHKTIIASLIMAVLFMFTDEKGVMMFFAVIAVAFIGLKLVLYIMPANEAIQKDQADLQTELDNPIYQAGAKGFPEKFYNYSDAFRLWKLISENRAGDLQSAFNLLETQHFQEDQMSIQEEIKGLQEDIAENARKTAANSRTAAVSSTIGAINSFRK